MRLAQIRQKGTLLILLHVSRFFQHVPDSLRSALASKDELSFCVGHPQIDTHVLRKRRIYHIPVLSGPAVPRRDLPEQADKYAIVILALFRPWSRSTTAPLKADSLSWNDALSALLSSLPTRKHRIIDHMQEQWECKLAADDFSANHRVRFADFRAGKGLSDTDTQDADLANDIYWQLGQLSSDSIVQPDNAEDLDDFHEHAGPRTPYTIEHYRHHCFSRGCQVLYRVKDVVIRTVPIIS